MSGLRLGLPSEEDDLIHKLEQAGAISSRTGALLRRMRGFRNLLVHEYGRVDDALVFSMAAHHLGDFDTFEREILQALEKRDS